jgi:hypothetical protein
MVNANVKSRQFCSVCKEWLDMEVVPTNDGDEDDGVIWFRCPRCQGFLPKLSGADLKSGPDEQEESAGPGETGSAAAADDDSMPWDSPADMMADLAAKETAARENAATEGESGKRAAGSADASAEALDESVADVVLPGDEDLAAVAETGDVDAVAAALPEVDVTADDEEDEQAEPSEPIMEYAAMLAEVDPEQAVPYRHWGTYDVGQCIHHLAWNDCGVVVAKEALPGGRQVIKVYFEEAGVVRLIEQAPR